MTLDYDGAGDGQCLALKNDGERCTNGVHGSNKVCGTHMNAADVTLASETDDRVWFECPECGWQPAEYAGPGTAPMCADCGVEFPPGEQFEEVSDGDFESYQAKYCEGCGQLFDASEKIRENTAEPVHRVHIIEAIGPFDEVGETAAIEEGRCDDCGGQVVKRWYAYPQGEVPEPDFEPDEADFSGRDPTEDALIAMSDDPDPEDFEEVREVPWLEDGDGL